MEMQVIAETMAMIIMEIPITETMDLIQINLQGTYSEDFYIHDCYRGFKFKAQVNGRKMKYDEKY